MDINEIIDSSIKEMKSIFESKTFWLAVVQGIAGILVVIESSHPGVGSIIIAKSFVDIMLRYLTTQSIA